RRLAVAGRTGLEIALQRTHDAMVVYRLPYHRDLGHVAVGAGDPGRPVRAVVGEELVLGVTDEAQLEAGHRLLPLAVGGRALDHLDNILDVDVAHLAPLPREEDIGR